MSDQILGSHPIADLLPPMSDAEYAELRDSIANGRLEMPIILFEGLILDGRHRNQACDETGAEKRFQEFEGTWDDAVGYVTAVNLARRNLSVAQRAMTAAKLANLSPGRPQKTVDAGTVISQSKAADMFAVSRESVNAAVKIQSKGVPELVEAVEKGEVSLTAGAAIAGTSAIKQRQTLRHKSDRIGSYTQRIKVESTLKRAKRSYNICLSCNESIEITKESWLANMHFLRLRLADQGTPEARELARITQNMIAEVEEMSGRGEYHSLALAILNAIEDAPQNEDDLATMLGAAKSDVQFTLKQFEANSHVRWTRQGGKTEAARGGAKVLWEMTPKGRIEVEKLRSSILSLDG
jgi:DNA-binding transcriptional regulator YdaS (Cro superfamily)